MKTRFYLFCLFCTIYFIYFAVATQFTFTPKWALDYFNQMAESLMHFRLDIPNPSSTYDLAHYNGKWYAPWGILPSLLAIPFQIIKGRYIPMIYINVFCASLNVVIMYLLLIRLKKDFLPRLSTFGIYLTLILFAFGTTHFYVGTLGGVWHVSQMTTFTLTMLGVYVIFKKNRSMNNYFYATVLFSLSFIGRATGVFLIALPISLYIWEYFLQKKISTEKKWAALKKSVIIFLVPILFFSSLFFGQNYIRYNNFFEYGYQYIDERSYIREIRDNHGVSSIKNIPLNAWYMLFEVPSISYNSENNHFDFHFNLRGNSILFLTPPFLAIFLAVPFIIKKKKVVFEPFITSLWITTILTIIPILMHFGSGWMQFGYRYSLDITVLLIILSLYGIKGRINILYCLGVIFSVIISMIGINALF